jgi:hypothetical protein
MNKLLMADENVTFDHDRMFFRAINFRTQIVANQVP